MAVSLCETFLSLASSTHRRLARARRVLHQPLEETFTDLNILELKFRHSTEIYSEVFTKRREGVNGADWEWWLTNSSRNLWLGLRIQAKVLHLANNTFEHLHYRDKKTKIYQLHKLQTEAARDGLVPLYCIYAHGVSRKTLRGRQCLNSGHATQSYGCSLVSPAHIARLQVAAETKDLYSVIQAAVPWHCLVCSNCQSQGADLPTRAWVYLQNEFEEMRNVTIDPKQEIRPGPRPNPPKHVIDILEGRITEDPPPNIQGVLVIAPHQNG
jgi:hypothetical protein